MTEENKSVLPENVDYLLQKFPIQCHKCGVMIGDKKLEDDCECGFSNEESMVQWVCEREGIES